MHPFPPDPAALAYGQAAGDVENDTSSQYLYDGEGRLCAVRDILTGAMTAYIYDAMGQRVYKGSISTFSCDPLASGLAETNQYVYGLNGSELMETDASNNVLHSNFFLNGQLLATNDYGTNWYYNLNDWLGSKRVVANMDGSVSTGFASLPFGDGQTQFGSGADDNEEHFTGKQRDTESGNDYFGARYYASSMGRFLSPDWSAKVEPVPYSKLENPQSLNLYSYVLNNPLSSVDPDGHSTLIYDGATHTMTLYSKSGQVLGQWHAANNVDSRASLGRLPNGAYPVLDQNSPYMHGNAVDPHDSYKQDSESGEYGPGGIFRVQPFKGPDGKIHYGVGVHAGRRDKPDAAGRKGPDHATEGCIRTCDAAVKKITDTVKTDPLTTVTVQDNRQPPPVPLPKKEGQQ